MPEAERHYAVMVVDDDSTIRDRLNPPAGAGGPVLIGRPRASDGARLALHDGEVFEHFDRALQALKQAAEKKAPRPDVVLLDDYFTRGEDQGAVPLGLAFMRRVHFLYAKAGVAAPLCVLHTSKIDSLVAYAFRVAGGHHVIDKQQEPNLDRRLDFLWEVIGGARWAPPTTAARLSDAQARVLACMHDPAIGNDRQAIAERLGVTVQSVDAARDAIYDKFLGTDRRERDIRGAPHLAVQQARRAGHVWVPLAYRTAVFRDSETGLPFPFDNPPRMEPREAPLP